MRAEPVLVRRVEDRAGNVLWQARVTPLRAVTAETAFLMSSMLSDVIQRGTASKARALGFKLPAAGKTGTTDNFQDAWFIGYTPHLIAGVWFGFDAPSRIMNEGFAATVAVPAWTTFMKQATGTSKPDWFQPPAGVTRVKLCRLSGQLATDECRLAAAAARGAILGAAAGSPPVVAAPADEVYDKYVFTGSVGPCELHRATGLPPIGAIDRPTYVIR